MDPRSDHRGDDERTRTKIVATVGPASDSAPVLDDLLVAGVDVVRLNLSHGTLESHIETLGRVREAADRVGQVVAVLADLPGPKVRSGQFPEGGIDLAGGAEVVLVPGEAASSAGVITVEYPTLLDDLRAFHRAFYQPANAALVVTGDVRTDAVVPLLERAFGGWSNASSGATRESAQPRIAAKGAWPWARAARPWRSSCRTRGSATTRTWWRSSSTG